MLFGCGGSDDSSPQPPSVERPPEVVSTLYYAQDVVRQSAPAQTFYVDLSNAMESSDGSSVAFLSARSLNQNDSCDVISQDTNGFTISAQSANVCDYRYKVGPAFSSRSTATSGDGYSEATVRAAVGETTEQLVPISAVTTSNTEVVVKIPTELSKSGYSLDTATYMLDTATLADSSSTSSVIPAPAENTIAYTPGAEVQSGVERILYSYSDGTNVLTGSLDIAVSTETNAAPLANSIFMTDFQDPDTLENVSQIPYGKTLEFDVATLITDPDGDTLQLIDVFAYGATINIPDDANGDGNYFNDTVFNFSSQEPGYASITYVVTDGRGGYATGVIKAVVSELLSPITVTSVSPSLTFLPPMRSDVADSIDVQYVSAGTGDGTTSSAEHAFALHDFNVANGICRAQGGRLPTLVEAQALYTEYPAGALFSSKLYPINYPYWLSDTGSNGLGSYSSFNMLDGSFSQSDISTDLRYVSCVADEQYMSYHIQGNDEVYLYPSSSSSVTYSYIGTDASPSETTLSDVEWFLDYGNPLIDATLNASTGELVVTNNGELGELYITACHKEYYCTKKTVLVTIELPFITYDNLKFTPLLTMGQAANYTSTGYLGIDTANDSYTQWCNSGDCDRELAEITIEPTNYSIAIDDYCGNFIDDEGQGGYVGLDASVMVQYMDALNSDPVYVDTAKNAPWIIMENSTSEKAYFVTGDMKLILYTRVDGKLTNPVDYEMYYPDTRFGGTFGADRFQLVCYKVD